MAWPEQILVASFRGVPFEISDRSRSGGRRGPTHEFPQREEPDGEDTGRKGRVFKINAFVHGDDYLSQGNALLGALETPGPGLYVDPWQGQWKVIARTYDWRESFAEQGVARFAITFEEAGEERYPTARADTRYQVSDAAAQLADAVVAGFDEAFTVAGLPQFVADAATDVTRAFADSLLLDLQGIPGVDASLVSDLSTAASSLTRSGLGEATRDMLDGLSGYLYSDRASNPGDPLAAADLFSRAVAFGLDLPAVQTLTTTRQRQADNQDAQSRLFRWLSLSREAHATARIRFDSYDATLARRSGFGDRIDAALSEAGNAGKDVIFGHLQTLRATVMTDLISRADGLPRVNRLVPATSEPAVVLAHRLWGDARRAEDLIARNAHITHGGFIPAGTSLEVLDA